MKLAGVHHISVNVDDLAAAEPFYVDVLGLEKMARPELPVEGIWLRTGDGRQVHLIEVDGHKAPKGQHFAFAVDDVPETCEELRSEGVRVSDPSEIPDVGRQAFFKDPAGNLIEINDGILI